MVVHLVIDHREQAIKDDITGFDHLKDTIVWENLACGDFAIRGDDGTTYLLIERKTVRDLAASIKDGRYKHQKDVLLATSPPLGVYYVIEGAVPYSPPAEILIDGISYSAILSCVLNTCIRDHIPVFITKDLKDTIGLITSIYSRIAKDPSKYLQPTSVQYEHVVKTTSKYIDKATCYEAQLCQIPGISMKTAKSIASKFSSMYQLCTAVSLNGSSALADIKVGGGKRCLAENVKERIVDYLSH